METILLILAKIGFEAQPIENLPAQDTRTVFHIQNPDGSVRWFWASHVGKPLFLKFYHATTLRAKCFVFLVRLIFALRLQRFVFQKTRLAITQKEASPLFDFDAHWAIFTGTTGINRKALAYTAGKEGSFFTKITFQSDNKWLLINEYDAIQYWQKRGSQYFETPNITAKSANSLSFTEVGEGANRSEKITPLHIKALKEIAQKTLRCLPLKFVPVYRTLREDLKSLNAQQDERLPKGMLRKLQYMFDSIRPDTVVRTCLSHGDFTPWNMYVGEEKLALYDWELSKPSMPLGFDAFHFIIQQGILVERKSWKAIYADIREKLAPYYDIKRYLRFYVLFNTVYYLKIYQQQTVWHTQIHWLLQVWNDALSTVLQQEKRNKGLLAMDIFDFLQKEPYAVLKYNADYPENINEYSDIDLCLDHTTAHKLLDYLKSHKLVKKAKIVTKSFMRNILLFLEDGDVLSIDCIWQFKRKAVTMLDAQDLLQTIRINEYGIKQPSLEYEARFIGLFYALNKASIPAHYILYMNILKKAESLLDVYLYEYSKQPSQNLPIIQEIVGSNAENEGIWGLYNSLIYLLDTVRGWLASKGLMITFSGVDGAGKSTVIENMRYILEKKLRKNVIVLRHRPSILPILSVWTKGKKKAQQDVLASLPRQGKNKNMLSSLLRFAYYYTDYFVGQFYVYARYILCGYVVLYDRYYFDFINDSERSNIHLPTFITKFGYRFLIKPDANFFLYAKPEVILERKKELDSPTIEKLNDKYLTLFKAMQNKKIEKRYFAIENVALEDTLEKITQKILTV
jgi:thymidylate kinase